MHRKRSTYAHHFQINFTRISLVVLLLLCELSTLLTHVQAAVTFTTGSVEDPSIFQAVTFTILSNPLSNDPIISTNDFIFLVADEGSCTLPGPSDNHRFPITAISSGGYSGTVMVPITPDIVTAGSRYWICFVSSSAARAIQVYRGFTSETNTPTMFIFPAVYDTYTLSPTTSPPPAGSGPVSLQIPQVTSNAVTRPMNQGLIGGRTILLVSCPSTEICAAGSSAALVERCATAGASYESESANLGNEVVALTEVTGQSTGNLKGSFVAPFNPSQEGYVVCIPYCSSSTCSNSIPSYTLVAADSRPSLSLVFLARNPSVYTRSPALPQAREYGTLFITGSGLSSSDVVRILASTASSCSASSPPLLTNTVLGSLQVNEGGTTASISFIVQAIIAQPITGLVCYFHASSQLWSPVFLDPNTFPEADFTVAVLQPSSFTVVPEAPVLGSEVNIFFSGTGLDGKSDAAFLSPSTGDNALCEEPENDVISFPCAMTEDQGVPVCTVLVNTEANEALELIVCYKKSGRTNFSQLNGIIGIAPRSPTFSLSYNLVYAGQVVSMHFLGDNMDPANDKVVLTEAGAVCSDNVSPLKGASIESTAEAGVYSLIGQAEVCVQVCYYLSTKSEWVISAPVNNDMSDESDCPNTAIYIFPFPLRYSIAAESSAANSGIGLTADETSVTSLLVDSGALLTVRNSKAGRKNRAIKNIVPIKVKIVQANDECATAFCGELSGCMQEQASSAYASPVVSSSTTTSISVMVHSSNVKYIFCAEISGLTGVFIPVTPLNSANEPSSGAYSFSALAKNPTLTKLLPYDWRAWWSQYEASFGGQSLGSISDNVYVLNQNSLLYANDELFVCPTPQSIVSSSTVLSSTIQSGGTATATTAVFSSGQHLLTDQQLFLCYLWANGGQLRSTLVSKVELGSPVPSSLKWETSVPSGFRAGNPFTLTLSSNTTDLSVETDTVFFYRFTYAGTANICFCSPSTCSSGTLVNYLETEKDETFFEPVEGATESTVQLIRPSGFDNYGYAAFYVTCYARQGTSVNTYLGVLPVAMADPTFYTYALLDGGTSARVGAPLRITAVNRCRSSDCPSLSSEDSLLLAPIAMACKDLVDVSSVEDYVTLIGAPSIVGGLTFAQVAVPLQEGEYRVCYKGSNSEAYSELAAQIGSEAALKRQPIPVLSANPSAFKATPEAPTAGQLMEILLTCESPRCDSCQQLRIVPGSSANCWEAVEGSFSSSNCNPSTTYSFPNVFLSQGDYTICFGGVLAESRRVPGTLTIGAANPLSFTPIAGQFILTSQINNFNLVISGTGLSAEEDTVFLLTEKGLTCHDLVNRALSLDVDLRKWLLPSVSPYPLTGTATTINWLVSNRQKRFGGGLLFNTTYCPGDNENCEMQLCYLRSGTSWAPVPIANPANPIYITPSDPYAIHFDQYPLIVNMYVMVTVSGSNLESQDTLAIFSEQCGDSPLSVLVEELVPQVSPAGTIWQGVLRITGSAQTYAVCYTRQSTGETVEITIVTLGEENNMEDTIIVLPSPLYYLLYPGNFTNNGGDSEYLLSVYEEMQVQAIFDRSASDATQPLNGVELIQSSGECNYPPFNNATGSTIKLPVLDVFELISGTTNGTSSAAYQGRLYFPNLSADDRFALCMETSRGYFRVVESSQGTSTAMPVGFPVGNALPSSFSHLPPYSTIGQTVAFTFTNPNPSEAQYPTLREGDVVEIIDGSLFECGFHNSTTSVSTALTTVSNSSPAFTTASLSLPYMTSLLGKKMTVCYRKQDGTFATVPIGTAVDMNYAVSPLFPEKWETERKPIASLPLSITFYPATSDEGLPSPQLSSDDIAFLVNLENGESVTDEARNAACQTGNPAVESTGSPLVFTESSQTTRWDISALPPEETTYVVCYKPKSNDLAIVYVSTPSVLTVNPVPSPTGTYTNRNKGTVFQGERFYLFFETAVELNVELDVPDAGSTAGVDLVRLSSTLDCLGVLPETAFQAIPSSFGYKPLSEKNENGITIPYLHLRVRAAVGSYYICMKRANQEPDDLYYNFHAIGGTGTPSQLKVEVAPLIAYSTTPGNPRAWVPSITVTPSYNTDTTSNSFVQMFMVPYQGNYIEESETAEELQYDDCYRPAVESEAATSTTVLVNSTLQVLLPSLVTQFPFPESGYYLLCYQLKSTSSEDPEPYFIASVYPSATSVLPPSPISFTVPFYLAVDQTFSMGFSTVDNIFVAGFSNRAQIYTISSPPTGQEAIPPSCSSGTVPENSVSTFTSFSVENSTYATVNPKLIKGYFFVCFLTDGQMNMFPLPNHDGSGYYFTVGILGPQSYTVEPQVPYLGTTPLITIEGSLMSNDDFVKVVQVDPASSANYPQFCTDTAPNADAEATSSNGVRVMAEVSGMTAYYRPRVNTTGTLIVCYRSELMALGWMYVSPLESFMVQDAEPSSYVQAPIPSYATANNRLVVRGSATAMSDPSLGELKLVSRSASGFDCTDEAPQSSLVVTQYVAAESGAGYAAYSLCSTTPVSVTVCYRLGGVSGSWAEVPLSSPPPNYIFRPAETAASPFLNIITLVPTNPRPFATFTMSLQSSNSDVEATFVSFAISPQSICALNIPYVPPVYYAVVSGIPNTFQVALPMSGSYMVYVGTSSDVFGPNITLGTLLVVGSCDPCSFTPPYAFIDTTVSLLFPSATGSSLSNGDMMRIIPVSQGATSSACNAPVGPFQSETFSPTAVAAGGASTTYEVYTGDADQADIYEGSYYICYKREGDETYAVVSNGEGMAQIFSILPDSTDIITAEYCPASGEIFGLEAVAFNLTTADPIKYPMISFGEGDELVVIQTTVLPEGRCGGVTDADALHAEYPNAVASGTLDSFSNTASNWYVTLPLSASVAYAVCFRLAYSTSFREVTPTSMSVLAANPLSYLLEPGVVLPTTSTFTVEIEGTGLSANDDVFLVSAQDGTCLETCYYSSDPKDWEGIEVTARETSSTLVKLDVTNRIASTSLNAVVLRVCYRRSTALLTELGQFYIGEKNPSSYTLNFAPREGTRPTITFVGKKLGEEDKTFLVNAGDYCNPNNALVYGSFLDIDSNTGGDTPSWISFYLPLTVPVRTYTVCYVLKTINAGVAVDELEVLPGGPRGFISSNEPMVGRAVQVSFEPTSSSSYVPQEGDSAYITCPKCSCYDETVITVPYGSPSASFENDRIFMRVGISEVESFPVCYKVYDSGYALVADLVVALNAPSAAVVYPSPVFQGQRLQYTFDAFSTAFPATSGDAVMLVSYERRCWETAEMETSGILVQPSTVSSVEDDKYALWDAHVPSVGPDTPSAQLFPLSYLLCYRQAGQLEYISVPFPSTENSWIMQSADPASFATEPSVVRVGMMGVVVTFPNAVEGDEVYLVAYNANSNTDCTDAGAQLLSSRGAAFPSYVMNISGGAPTGDQAGVFCYIKKGATVAEVPELLKIFEGNPSGYTIDLVTGNNARYRDYLNFTVSGSGLSAVDDLAFAEESCAAALAGADAAKWKRTLVPKLSSAGHSEGNSAAAPLETLDKMGIFELPVLGSIVSVPLLARLSDFTYSGDGTSLKFVAQFLNLKDVAVVEKLYLCYAIGGTWTEVGDALVLSQPEPESVLLYNANPGSIAIAPLRVGQHLQIELSGVTITWSLEIASVISGNSTNPQSWCSNFTDAGVLEPGLVIESSVLLDVPVWMTAGTSRLCLFPSPAAPWRDASETIYAPLLPEVFPANPQYMTVYPVVPRVGQQVTFTFFLIVTASSTDAVKFIEDKGNETLPCGEASSLVGFPAQGMFVTIIDNLTTSITPLDETDPLQYRSFNTSRSIRVCYYSGAEEAWSAVSVQPVNPSDTLSYSVLIKPRAPTSWEVYEGSLVMGRTFQLAFYEEENAVLDPEVDRVWGVPSGLNCTASPESEACPGCIDFTIDAVDSDQNKVITAPTGTTVVNEFFLCYRLKDATPAFIPEPMVIVNGTIECSVTKEVTIGLFQTVLFQKQSGVSVTDDTWRASIYAADAAIGCEAYYDPNFPSNRVKQTTVTDTSVSYELEWPVSMNDERYIICYSHTNMVGPVCTCEQLEAKNGECYLKTERGSPSSFVSDPYPTYVGQSITLTFILLPDLVEYPLTAVKFVLNTNDLLATCEDDAAFTPLNPEIRKVNDTAYAYSFQHDYRLGSSSLLVCALTPQSEYYIRVGSPQGDVLFIRPYMSLTTFPSEAKYIRTEQTLLLNFTHESRLEDDVVSDGDQLYFVSDPYQCTEEYINAQDPVERMKAVLISDTAFSTLPADVSAIDEETLSSFSFVTYAVVSEYYMCYKLANGGTWAPVLPYLDVLEAVFPTCTLPSTEGSANGEDGSLRAMQYIAITLNGDSTLEDLLNPGLDVVRVVPVDTPCAVTDQVVYEGGVASTSTPGILTTVAFSPSAGSFKLCYRLGGSTNPVVNWSPVCTTMILSEPTPVGSTVGCFATSQAIEVTAQQLRGFIFTTQDTFRFVAGDQPCLLPSHVAVEPSTTITVGDAAQAASGISPTPQGATTFEIPYALLREGTSSVRLCYIDSSGKQFAIPLKYEKLPAISSMKVEAAQPSNLEVQQKITVGQRFIVNFTSSADGAIELTPYAPFPNPFEFAPPFNGTFDGSALVPFSVGTVYSDGRCIAMAKEAGASNDNPLNLLGVYGVHPALYTTTGFAPTIAERYITCYRLAECLVADVGPTLFVRAPNPSSVETGPTQPRRGQLIKVLFFRNTVEISEALIPGKDRGAKEANLASCWNLDPIAGSVVEGTADETYIISFFPAQPPQQQAVTTTISCYHLDEGSWAQVPSDNNDVLPANPTGFSTNLDIPRANQQLRMFFSGTGLSTQDYVKILSGDVGNCTNEAEPHASIYAYGADGKILANSPTGWPVLNMAEEGTLSSIDFAANEEGTFRVCYRLAKDEVWTLVYGILTIAERNPNEVVITPVSILEQELFTLHFSASSSGTLVDTDRVVLYAGENVNCINPEDAVSISAAPSDTSHLPMDIYFQLDCGTRGKYTICYLATSSASGSNVVRYPVWGFPVVQAEPNPISLVNYPGGISSPKGLRAKQIVSMVFQGFGLIADEVKKDEVKLISAVENPSPTDALCRSATLPEEITLLPLYANGTYAVQLFLTSTNTNANYWVCYRLSGGLYHHIGEMISTTEAANPLEGTTDKKIAAVVPRSFWSTWMGRGVKAAGTFYDGEAIPWTLSGNTLCNRAEVNYLFYSAIICGDIPYYADAITSDEESSRYFPLGFARVNCASPSPTYVRIADAYTLEAAFKAANKEERQLSLCYYYGAATNPEEAIESVFPSTSLVGDPNDIEVSYGVPSPLANPLDVEAMSPFNLSLNVSPTVNDYCVIVGNPNDCVGATAPTSAALFLIQETGASGLLTVVAAVLYAGTFYICYSNRVGRCAESGVDCARIVGTIQASAPSPSSWIGSPNPVYTTDNFEAKLQFPSSSERNSIEKAWLVALETYAPSRATWTMEDVYTACKNTVSIASSSVTSLVFNSATDRWVAENRLRVDGLHALCYTDSELLLHLFGPVSYAGPIVLESQIVSGEWASLPVYISTISSIWLNGGGLTGKDYLVAVGFTTALVPEDICSSTSYLPRVEAEPITGEEADQEGLTSIKRSFEFKLSGAYVLCYRSSLWDTSHPPSLVTAIGSFSVLPNVITVTVANGQPYVNMPVVLLFVGSGFDESQMAAFVYLGNNENVGVEICEESSIVYSNLQEISNDRTEGRITTTPINAGLHAVCFRSVGITGEVQTVLLPTRITVYTLTATKAAFAGPIKCNAGQLCNPQPIVQLTDASEGPASTPGSTIRLWLADSNNANVTSSAGLIGGDQFFFEDDFSRFRFLAVSIYKEGTYRMIADVVLPNNQELTATSSFFTVITSEGPGYVASLKCSPSGIIQTTTQIVTCEVETLRSDGPSGYEIQAVPGEASECKPMATPSENGWPRCEFTVTPPSVVTTSYMAIYAIPADPFSSWPVESSPQFIRLPRIPSEFSTMKCASQDATLSSSNFVRMDEDLTCNVQGKMVDNGVVIDVVSLPSNFNILYFVNSEENVPVDVSLPSYPEDLNGLYVVEIPVLEMNAKRITVKGTVRSSSNAWTPLVGSPESFVVLGTPTAWATFLVCVSAISGSRTFFSPYNVMKCSLSLGNAAGSILGIMQDYAVTMPKGGRVETLPPSTEATESLYFTAEAPVQPPAALEGSTFEFLVVVNFTPTQAEVSNGLFGLVYVTKIVTSPLPEYKKKGEASLLVEGSGLLLYHSYLASSVEANCSSGNAITAVKPNDTTLRLSFRVPDATAFYICYKPSDGDEFQPLLSQSFITAKSDSEWTTTLIILFVVGLLLLLALLALLLILLWRLYLLYRDRNGRSRNAEDRVVPEYQLPPINTRYVAPTNENFVLRTSADSAGREPSGQVGAPLSPREPLPSVPPVLPSGERRQKQRHRRSHSRNESSVQPSNNGTSSTTLFGSDFVDPLSPLLPSSLIPQSQPLVQSVKSLKKKRRAHQSCEVPVKVAPQTEQNRLWSPKEKQVSSFPAEKPLRAMTPPLLHLPPVTPLPGPNSNRTSNIPEVQKSSVEHSSAKSAASRTVGHTAKPLVPSRSSSQRSPTIGL